MTSVRNVGFLGLGEAGAAMATTLAARNDVSVYGYDAALDDPPEADSLLENLTDRVTVVGGVEELVAASDYVFSLVTSDAAAAAARDMSRFLTEGKTVLDGNSTSARVVLEIASGIEATGARLVDLALMAAVSGRGYRVPMLASGREAIGVAESLNSLGFDIEVIGETPGLASTVKMMRSVVVKGVEALLLESLAAASAYGVTDHVLTSLDTSFPEGTWRQRADYFASRTTRHALRRASELEQAAEAVRAGGVEPLLTTASAERLRHASVVLRGRESDAIDSARLADLIATGRSDA